MLLKVVNNPTHKVNNNNSNVTNGIITKATFFSENIAFKFI